MSTPTDHGGVYSDSGRGVRAIVAGAVRDGLRVEVNGVTVPGSAP